MQDSEHWYPGEEEEEVKVLNDMVLVQQPKLQMKAKADHDCWETWRKRIKGGTN